MSTPQPPAEQGEPQLPSGEDHPGPRPTPQYGEYATPEQQRAAIRQPAPAASVPEHAPAASPSAQAAPSLRTQAHATTSVARSSRAADRIVTLALLAYGLVTVLSAVPQLWHFAGFAQTWMDVAGIDGTFTNTAQGDLWGRIGAGVFMLGWLLTALLSWRSLARHRLSWWIPLVGAIVSFLIVTICLMVPLLDDPAIVGTVG